jgi:hypothetical protein
MTGSVGTYFDAWNETDAASRSALLERCLTGDVELIDENGRFRGCDGLSSLIANFHEQVPGGRVVRSSGIDQFDMRSAPSSIPRRRLHEHCDVS